MASLAKGLRLNQLAAPVLLLSGVQLGSAQWQAKQEFYVEHRESGVRTYYSPDLYVELDPASKNYREYRYDLKYGKDYYWQNYDGGIYSEREFVARYNQLTYYTDSNDELRDWGYQMGLAAGIAGGCCVVITIAIVVSQCLIRRRKRKKEQKAQLEMADMEGLGMDASENASKDTEGEPDLKKKKKSTSDMKNAALEKKSREQKMDPTVVVDYDEDDGSFNMQDGTRREMLSANDSVRPGSKRNRPGSNQSKQSSRSK